MIVVVAAMIAVVVLLPNRLARLTANRLGSACNLVLPTGVDVPATKLCLLGPILVFYMYLFIYDFFFLSSQRF